MIKLVIFDLDDTLVDTSIFKDKRDNKEWEELPAYLNSFSVIGNGDNSIKDLKDLGIIIVIMTKSPRNYSEQILKKFNIQYDKLYAYHDLMEIKQSFHAIKSDAICQVKEIYGLKSNEILFIGDSIDDYKSCEETNIMFITHSQSQASIDFKTNLYCIDSYDELKDLLNNPSFDNYIKIHKGSFSSGYEYVSLSNYISNSYEKLPYRNTEFYMSYDAMHKRIKELKENDKIVFIIKWLIFLENIDWKELFPDIDCVTRTLSSNELKIDTNNIKPLDIIGTFIAEKLSCNYMIDILTQNQIRGKLSHSGLAYGGRKELLSGIIDSKTIEKQNVLLLDDIITTGATTEVSIDSIKLYNPNIKIQAFSIARTVNFSKEHYLDNINNLQYFPCTKIDAKYFSIFNVYLVSYLLDILNDNKYFTLVQGIYRTGVLKIEGINIFGKNFKYLYFSIRTDGDNLSYESMYVDYFNTISTIGNINVYKEKFINNAIKYFDENAN